MKKVLWYVGPWKGTGAIFAIFDLNFGLFFKFRENAAPLRLGEKKYFVHEKSQIFDFMVKAVR